MAQLLPGSYELSVDGNYSHLSLEVFLLPSALPARAQPGDLIAILPTSEHINQLNSKSTKPVRLPPKPILYVVEEPSEGGVAVAGGGADLGLGRAGAARQRNNKASVVVNPAIAANFDWLAGSNKSAQVTIELFEAPAPAEFTASHVELYFSNMYLGRSDMFRLSLALNKSALNLGQRITLPGSSSSNRIRVGGLFSLDHKPLKSAYVNDDTKIVFRSESARTVVFIEVAQEMWQFEEDGSMLQSKCELFLTELIGKWKGTGVNGRTVEGKRRKPPTSHTVSVILYGRVIYEEEGEAIEPRAPLQKLEDGTLYRDFYKVVIDDEVSPSSSIVRKVAAEMRAWQENVLLRTRESGERKLAGRIAFAHESPVLEATNLALNINEEHWVDRDLHKTGFYLSIVTAGTSFYHVPKDLLRLTTERMLCHGIGLDLISLSKTPLHTVPLFSFRSHEPGLAEQHLGSHSTPSASTAGGGRYDKRGSVAGLELGLAVSPSTQSNMTVSSLAASFASTRGSAMTRESLIQEAMRFSLPSDQRDPLYYDSPQHPTAPQDVYYAEPLFVFCSFFGSQVDKPYRIDRFMPRARCYELFSQGVGERMAVAIPLLVQEDQQMEREEEGWGYLNEMEKRQRRRERYDDLAIGVKAGQTENGMWPRQSGATSGASIGSDGRRRESTTSEEDDAGIPLPAGARLRRPPMAEGRRTVSAMVGGVAEERERGRRDQRRLDEERKASSTVSRSRTPVGRPQRDVSVAASTRTISSNWSNGGQSKTTKTATPALIARLATVGTRQNPPEVTSKQSGWLGFLSGRATGHGSAPAPSVSVQRIDAIGHDQANHDILDPVREGSIKSTRQPSSHGSPASLVSRRASLAPAPTPRSLASPLPTQPISIGTRVPKIRDLDQQRAAPAAKLVSSSPSMQIIHPSVDEHKLDRKRLGGPSRFNPSKPGKRSLGLADQVRRWASIFIRHTNDQRAVNWISITRGACLPLTTDYVPTPEAIASEYNEQAYAVSTKATAESFFIRPAERAVVELVAELISQRVSFGFQICLPQESTVAVSTLAEILEGLKENAITKPIYLSLANQIHCISYDRRTEQVEVRIARVKHSWKKKDYSYSPLVWTSGTPNYVQTDFELPYPKLLDHADWEKQDNLIAGTRRPDARTSSRHWRTRLVLLPDTHVEDRAEILARDRAFEGRTDFSDEEIRHQGFMVLLEAIENLRWTAPGQNKDPMPITYTTKSAPEWAREAARELENLPALSTDAVAPPTPAPQTQRWLQRVMTPHSNALQRDESTSGSGSGSGKSLDRTATSSPARGEDPSPSGRQSPALLPAKSKATVQMTHAVVLDLDQSGKSDRAERVVCHLDRSHNVAAAYHIELTWLTSSGRMIDLALRDWTKIAARYGLKLVEVSTRGVNSKHNPFQRARPVQLAVAPPDIEEGEEGVGRDHYEDALLRSLDFFLDIGADDTFPQDIDVQYSYKRHQKTERSQYIHRSGTMLVSVLEEGDVDGIEHGFAFTPNQNYILKTDLKADAVPRYEELVQELKGVCGDEERLRAFWEEEREKVALRGNSEAGAGAGEERRGRGRTA